MLSSLLLSNRTKSRPPLRPLHQLALETPSSSQIETDTSLTPHPNSPSPSPPTPFPAPPPPPVCTSTQLPPYPTAARASAPTSMFTPPRPPRRQTTCGTTSSAQVFRAWTVSVLMRRGAGKCWLWVRERIARSVGCACRDTGCISIRPSSEK